MCEIAHQFIMAPGCFVYPVMIPALSSFALTCVCLRGGLRADARIPVSLVNGETGVKASVPWVNRRER